MIQQSPAARLGVLFASMVMALCPAMASEPHWFKGNLHTHSFWSDGDDFPEMVVGWYKEHGYNFLALSDHNRLAAGERWTNCTTNQSHAVALEKYLQKFGSDWVVRKDEEGQTMVRLKTFDEFRPRFDEPGR